MATLAKRRSRRMVRCGTWLSTVGIVPNMFADVTRSSTPLTSSFPRFFSRAGELRFLE